MGKKIIFSEEQIKDIIKMYEDNSITSIAKKYNCSNQTITIRNGNNTGGDSWENPFSYTSNLVDSHAISVNDNNTISATNISSPKSNIAAEDIIDGAVEALLSYNKDGSSKVKNVASCSTTYAEKNK